MNHSPNLVPARTSGIGTERHFSVKEVAGIWGLSDKVVRRLFSEFPVSVRNSEKIALCDPVMPVIDSFRG